MFAPLRSAFAAQFTTCNMNADMASATESASNHQQHMMNSLQETVDQVNMTQADITQAKNCCGDKGACKSDCHIAISTSLFMQRVDYAPLLINTDTINNISSTLLVRELSPPSRPPLALYS